MENPIKTDDLGGFPPIFGNAQMFFIPLPLEMPAHKNSRFLRHQNCQKTSRFLRVVVQSRKLCLFEAPSYTLHAPAIIQVVGRAEPAIP